MKKSSTVAIEGIEIFKPNQLTIGLDLGDRTSRYCVLNEAGEIILEQELARTPKGFQPVFRKIPRSRIALETGTHSPWVSRQLTELGHEGIVAHARNVRLISREQPERRSAGCPDASTSGANRSQLAWSGATSQCEGPDPSDGDPGAGGAGQRAYGAGECGPRAHEILRCTASEMRRRTDESRDYQKSQAGVAGSFRTAAG